MEDKQDEQQPNLPTILEIESRIWKIAKSNKVVGSMQLEACRFLIERIEAREKRRRQEDHGGTCKNGRSRSR